MSGSESIFSSFVSIFSMAPKIHPPYTDDSPMGKIPPFIPLLYPYLARSYGLDGFLLYTPVPQLDQSVASWARLAPPDLLSEPGN